MSCLFKSNVITFQEQCHFLYKKSLIYPYKWQFESKKLSKNFFIPTLFVTFAIAIG